MKESALTGKERRIDVIVVYVKQESNALHMEKAKFSMNVQRGEQSLLNTVPPTHPSASS